MSDTNPYLRDKKKRREMVARNTFDSSVFEGASPHALRKDTYRILRLLKAKAAETKQDKDS